MAADEDDGAATVGGRNELLLPVSRIRVIMKSSPDVENVASDALQAVTGATEMFIKDLVLRLLTSKDGQSDEIDYNDLAELVNSEDVYSFLDEIVPKKVLGRDILKQMKNGQPSDEEVEDVDT